MIYMNWKFILETIKNNILRWIGLFSIIGVFLFYMNDAPTMPLYQALFVALGLYTAFAYIPIIESD